MTRKRTKLYDRQYRHSEDPLKPANDQELSMNKKIWANTTPASSTFLATLLKLSGTHSHPDARQIYSPVYGTSHYIASRIDADFLNAHPPLDFITTRSAGHDHIDVGKGSRRGVVVCEVLDVDCYHIAESETELWQKLDTNDPAFGL